VSVEENRCIEGREEEGMAQALGQSTSLSMESVDSTERESVGRLESGECWRKIGRDVELRADW
jgi:hypothetical protein